MTDRPSVQASSPFVSERRAFLVGRASELRELDDALAAVERTGEVRVVSVIGAPGVGKTRLVRDFLQRARVPGRELRVCRGSARDQGAAYGLFARVLRARFDLVESDDAETAKAQLRARTAEVLEDRKIGDVVYFLGQLLDLEFEGSPLIRAIEDDLPQLRNLRRAVIKRFLEADAAPREGAPRGPLVLVLDDLHWAHDDSLDLLSYLIEYLAAPILIVCLSRGDLLARRDDWRTRGHGRHSVIELQPLSETDSAAVMQELLAPAGDDEAVEELIDAACTLAGGNPSLLEQMVRIFRDMGVVEVVESDGPDDEWVVHPEKLASVRLPMTVEDAVQARIAALTPLERDLLERAAAMGSVFWVGGLVSIERRDMPAPEFWSATVNPEVARIRDALRDLAARDYVLRLPDSSFGGDEEYVFKHNLEREALLKITPAARARVFHHAIADWLASKEGIRGQEEPLAMLAGHWEKAGNASRAARSGFEAGDAARERYGHSRAMDHYARGLALLSDTGADIDTDRQLAALHHYGDCLQAVGRTEAALDAFRRMLALAFKLGRTAKGGAAHGRIGRLHRDTGKLELAQEHLRAALALFASAGDERGVASTTDDIGKLYWLKGDYKAALSETQRGLTMRRKLGDRRSIALSLNNMGLVYQDSGEFRLALDAFEQALMIRQEIGDLVGVTISLSNLGTVAQDQRDDVRALKLFKEAHEVAKETGDRNRIALVLTNLGETLSRLGQSDAAIAYLKQAEELADELGDRLGLAEAVRGLGKAYMAQRDFTKARECIGRAVEILRAGDTRVQLGVALRSLGEVSAAGAAGGAGLAQARDYLSQSIAIFEEAGNQVELARSYRAFADLLRGTMEHQVDPRVEDEAAAYSLRADAVLARVRSGIV